MAQFAIQVLSVSTSMYFIFRADSSIDIGTGHIMRCITLANALKAMGHECTFICKQHSGNINSLIIENDFELHELEIAEFQDSVIFRPNMVQPKYYAWIGSSLDHDAKLTNKILEKRAPDWIVVDHYALDVSWHKKVRGNTKNIMVIDDLANRHHDCEILVDQNLGADREVYMKLVPSHCNLFLGPKYALLRPEFRILRGASLFNKRLGKLRRILINFGGGDNLNLTEKVLKSLSRIKLPKNLQIDVIVGPQVILDANISSFKDVFFGQIKISQNVKNMGEAMMNADLAISAGGSTSWERCALGLPSMIFSVAENQKKITENIVASGAGVALNELSLLNGEFEILLQKFFSKDVLLSYSKAASNVTDGSGVSALMSKLDD